MFDKDKWSEIFESISRHKLRTFLTALAVWWGIFMLVILIGAGNGLSNSVEKNFGDDAINSVWIRRGQTSMPHKGLPAGRFIQFDNEDYDLLKNQVDGVEYLTGRYYFWGEYVVKYKEKVLSFDVRSVHPDHKYLENTIVTNGRFLNDKDIAETRKVAVIGQIVSDDFFGKKANPIGEYISIKNTEYRVVGVFSDEGSDNEMRKIYIPISTAQRVYEGNDRIHQLMLTVGNATLEETEVISENIRAKFAEKHQFSPEDKQAIYIRNNIAEFQRFQMVFLGIKTLIWFVGIGSIIAGMIGVSNIMLIVVKDRTQEIGIRKALGATPRDIISMIVTESVFLTAIAGYLGLLMGFGVIYGLSALLIAMEAETEYFYNPEVSFGAVLIALLILVLSGLLAGLIPAMQAVKINPVVAMKS